MRYLLLLLFPFYSFGQCDDPIRIIEGECKRVEMSAKQFAYYYKTDKNLTQFKKQYKKLVKDIEKERATQESIKENLSEQIGIVNEKQKLTKEMVDECFKSAVELEVDNIYYQKQIHTLKKQRPMLLGGGALGAIILILLIR